MKTLTSGSKGDRAITFMAKTFKELSNYADWSEDIIEEPKTNTPNDNNSINNVYDEFPINARQERNKSNFDLNYDIHIHLPATRDQAVYDALFSSLSKHINMR